MAPPPVASTRSTWRISSWVSSTLGSWIICTRSSGAPTLASPRRMKSTAILLLFLLLGWGAKITALPPLRMEMALLAGVAVGLVTGVRAPITPAGLAYFRMPFDGSSSISPTDLAPLISFSTPSTFPLCFLILSSTLPMPVSATAFSAKVLMLESS